MWGRIRSKRIKNLIWAFVIAIACSAAALALGHIRFIKIFEQKTYDARLQISLMVHKRPTPEHVVMFYVDEKALRDMESQGLGWPWPREMYSSVLKFCKSGGARAVVFDLFFSEDSVYGVEDDRAFAKGLADSENSYLVLFATKDEQEMDERLHLISEKSKINFEGAAGPWMIEEKSLISMPIDVIAEGAHAFGNAKALPDEDGIYRRIALIEKVAGGIMPSMSLKVASDLKGSPPISWPSVSRFTFGTDAIPLDEDGRMIINYQGGADAFPVYSLSDILVSEAAIRENQTPQISPDAVKGKVVIVGLAAPGLYDLKSTPTSRVFPGPEVHATVIENLLDGDYIRPTGLMTNILVTVFFALLSAFALLRVSSLAGIGGILIATNASLAAAGIALMLGNVWLNMMTPFMALWSSGFATFIRNYLVEGRKKQAIRKAFSQYLSPHVVGEISKNPDSLVLGGVEQEITLLFSDIADFTTISEKMAPTDLVKNLNEYFSLTTRIIQDMEGTLDKYIGDAIMAFWGAPLRMEDHALRAVTAAMGIRRLAGSVPFKTRMGVHTGTAVVGNIGSDIRFNYTSIGDAVNLASRLEGLNKLFGTFIIISESTERMCAGEIESRRIGRVRVKGRGEAVAIYEPLSMKGEAHGYDMNMISRFDEALAMFEKASFAEAKGIFGDLRASAKDGVSSYYEKLCEQHIKNPLDNFDGIINISTK